MLCNVDFGCGRTVDRDCGCALIAGIGACVWVSVGVGNVCAFKVVNCKMVRQSALIELQLVCRKLLDVCCQVVKLDKVVVSEALHLKSKKAWIYSLEYDRDTFCVDFACLFD